VSGLRAAERRTVLYSGQVQGVGFRFTTVQVARGFKVGGYVRNLDDGRVELVAEGLADELDRFLAAVADELQPYIRNVRTSSSPGTGEFGTFTIQR
jgi:acylphosphatase